MSNIESHNGVRHAVPIVRESVILPANNLDIAVARDQWKPTAARQVSIPSMKDDHAVRLR